MDMIVQSEGAQGRADMSFTIARDDLQKTLKVVEEVVKDLSAEGYTYDDNVAKISVVGLGMATQPGVAGAMFRALAEKGINIDLITTSEIKISVLFERQYATEALRAVHQAFNLNKPPKEEADSASPAAPVKVDPAELVARLEKVARLERLEKLIIDEIALDETQAMVTLLGIADIPGLAAQTFDELAEAGIVVDMIVQSIGRDNRADISLTVKREDLKKALHVAEELSNGLGCPPPTHNAQIAKLSVFGTGIKSHSGVASRMFKALAEAEINLDLIGTSEVRINVVVDGKQGAKALDVLKKEFADALV